MNTINQTFDWSRFTATLRKEVVENARTILFSIIGVYALLTVLMILGNLVAHTQADISMMMTLKAPQFVVFLVLSIFACVMPSMAFAKLKTKSGRTSMFMSPSSTLEKFLVNVLIYIVGTLVVFFVCAQLADLTRIAVLKLFESEKFVVPGVINFLDCFSSLKMRVGTGEMNIQHLLVVASAIGVVSSTAMYLLGSIIWPKLSLLKTYAAGFVLEIIFFVIALIVALIVYLSDNMDAAAEWFENFIRQGYFFWGMIIYSSILAVVCFALSWYLFKRKDVVSLKWWK